MTSSSSQGILTDHQREFIQLSEAERKEKYDRRQRYRYRSRIRSRIANAMKDFRFLTSLEPDEVEDALTPDEDEVDPKSGFPAAFQFLAFAQDVEDEQLYPGIDQQPAYEEFTQAAEKGLERDIAERKESVADVSVTVEIEGLQPPKAALRQLEHGDISADEKFRLAGLLWHTGLRPKKIHQVAPEFFADQLHSPKQNEEQVEE